jgi:hypothetical protein
MKTSGVLTQPGRDTDPNCGWCIAVPDVLSKRLSDLRVPLANSLVDLGRETGASLEP